MANFNHDMDAANQLARLLARQREMNAPEDMTVRPGLGAPDIGILSRTLVPSSMTKWIIPIRFGNGPNLDLLFVGENVIHIKRVIPDVSVDFRLWHRQSLPYIDSAIRSIALLGISNVAPSRDNTSKLPSVTEVMNESKQPDQDWRREYPIQVIIVALQSGQIQLLRPQLNATEPWQRITFKAKQIALPFVERRATLPGTRIAVDPFSRAVAVAAAFDNVVVYNIRSRMAMSTSLAGNDDNWNPIEEERIMSVPGRIAGIEFLNPGPECQDVILIIITAQGRRNTMTCFAWDHSEGAKSMRKVLQELIPAETGTLCNMIVPMAHTPDFLLIHGDTVNLYDHVLTGRPRMYNIENKESNWEAEPNFPASSRRRPQFTAWARPGRVPQFNNEFIFFIREDGVLRHYHRHSERTVPVGEVANSGHFNCHVDTAFASFTASSNLPDYVIAAGDMSSGEFHSVGVNLVRQPLVEGARNELLDLVKLITLPDWAPIIDMQITDIGPHSDRPALLVTSGRQPFGAVNELRLGHQAEINRIVEIDDSLFGASRMWVLQEDEDKEAHCIISYPYNAIAVEVGLDWDTTASGILMEHDDAVFATVVREGRSLFRKPIVLIASTHAITMQHFPPSGLSDEVAADRGPFYNKRWAEPIVLVSGHEDMIAVVTRSAPDTYVLELFQVQPEPLEIFPRDLMLPFYLEISALHFYIWDAREHVVLAFRDGGLVLYSIVVNPSSGELKLQALSLIESPSKSIVHSIVALPTDANNILVCGTRDGTLWRFTVRENGTRKEHNLDVVHDMYTNAPESPLRLHDSRQYNIGHGPVHVRRDDSSRRVFVLCDNKTLWVQANYDGSDIRIERFFLTSWEDDNLHSPSLAAIAGLPALTFDLKKGIVSDKSTNNARLICHDGSRLLLANLYEEEKVIPRRVPLKKEQASLHPDGPRYDVSGTPTKLLYSKTLEAIIAVGVKYEHRPNRKVPEPAWQGKRASRGFLTIIPVGGSQDVTPADDDWNRSAVHLDLAPAERVVSGCEWIYEHDRRKQPFLIIGTSVNNSGNRMIGGRLQRVQHGRLWFLIQSKNTENGQIELTLKYIKNFPEKPVRALAVMNSTKLIVAPHGELRVYSFTEDFMFTQLCKVEIPSAAIHITTANDQIMVTTVQHSVSAYQYHHDPPRLEHIFNDNIQRNGITHTLLNLELTPVESAQMASASQVLGLDFTTATQSQRATNARRIDILLGADKSGQVFGVEIPKTRIIQNAAPTVFELRLPQSITSFARGLIRAPWHERGTPVDGVLVDDVAGATTDGTVYHFTVLTNEARCLLKFLENLVRWNERQDRISSFQQEYIFSGYATGESQQNGLETSNNAGQAHPVLWPDGDIVIDPEYIPGQVGQRHRRDQYGVNGDLLFSLIDQSLDYNTISRTHRLHAMLIRRELLNQAEQNRARSSRHTGNEPETRMRKFEELVARVGLRGLNATEACLRWLDEVLRPVL